MNATAQATAYLIYVWIRGIHLHWSQRGAHLLLQVRAQVLNHELRETFRRWYPAMRVETETAVRPAA